jgi:hypothetical protein
MRHGIVNDGGTNSNGRFVVCLCRRRSIISIIIIQAIHTVIIHVAVVVVVVGVVSGRSHGRKVRESVYVLVQQQKNERRKERKKEREWYEQRIHNCWNGLPLQ